MTFKLVTLSTNPIAHGFARLLPCFTVSLSTDKKVEFTQNRKRRSFHYKGMLSKKEEKELFHLMHLMQKV